MTIKSKLSAYFQNLSHKKRKALSIFGGIAVLFALLWVAVVATSGGAAKRLIAKERKPEYTILGDHNPREVSVEALSGRLRRLQDDFSGVKESLGRSEEKVRSMGDSLNARAQELQKQNSALEEKTRQLAEELADTKNQLALPLPLPLPSLDGEKKNANNSNGVRRRQVLDNQQSAGQGAPYKCRFLKNVWRDSALR